MGDFPIIDVPLIGGGLSIGLIAVIHVFLAHYAVGVGFMLYGLERSDPGGKIPSIQRMLDLLGFSVIYVSFVLGAITGVGIWFSISLFSPDATQHLIQTFVWFWANEYTFFAVEIVVGYIYYYNRRRLSWERRKQLTLIYMLFTWGSLLMVTPILSAMLTWREGNAIVAWLNPSAFPSVLLRTLSAIALACLVILALATVRPWFTFSKEEKQPLYRIVYRYMAWFFLMLPIAIWYRLSIPATAASFAEGSSVPISMFLAGTAFFSLVVTVVSWYAFRRVRILQAEAAAMLLVMGLVATVSAEFVREGIRKPYIIAPILYSNAIWADDVPEWRRRAHEEGSVLLVDTLYPGTAEEKPAGRWQLPDDLVHAQLSPAERGSYLFRSQCLICHTRKGFNAILHLTRAWGDEGFAAEALRNQHISKPFMPPFVGTDRDVTDLTAYIQSLHARHDSPFDAGRTHAPR